jgi:putative transposase
MRHYNEPGHAHELTLSFYRGRSHGNDTVLCELFLEELDHSRQSDDFLLRAYVIMPSHVHMLNFPRMKNYSIAKILQTVKGKTSRRYLDYIIKNNPKLFDGFYTVMGGQRTFRLWQAGGGFDRNLWNSKPIHHSIEYIEGNPVRAGLVQSPEEWKWSSAYARIGDMSVIPDSVDIPIYMK